MSEEMLNKIRRILLYTAFLMVAFLISYVLAYPLGYTPLGYGVQEKKESMVVLQSYNSWGMEGEEITYQPPEADEWERKWLIDLIGEQDHHYLLFFASVIVSIFWVGVDVLKGKPLKSVLILSSFYVLMSTLPLVQHLNDIKDILQNSL